MLNKGVVMDLYCNQYKSIKEIHNITGYCEYSIRSNLQAWGVYEPAISDGRGRPIKDNSIKDKAIELYKTTNFSYKHIGEILKTPLYTVATWINNEIKAGRLEKREGVRYASRNVNKSN